MKHIYLLISPEVKGAYFADYIECSLSELLYCVKDINAEVISIGLLNFISFQISEERLSELTKLSFYQGIFEYDDGKLSPLDISPAFGLHDSFIFGSKFKGKTNERFTQMMINVGIASIDKKAKIKLLDPMCGRATTLLWSMRYGMSSKGVELDSKALGDIKQIVRKWSKICSVSIKTKDGFISKKAKSSGGKFLEVVSKETNFKVVTGNTENTGDLLSNERFDLIVSDLPYGIQHAAVKGTKNPLATLEVCLPVWKDSLSDGGVIVLGFNANNPRRKVLEQLAESFDLEVVDFTASHRMSESIVRDIIVLK